jgi:hypothetical protein
MGRKSTLINKQLFSLIYQIKFFLYCQVANIAFFCPSSFITNFIRKKVINLEIIDFIKRNLFHIKHVCLYNRFLFRTDCTISSRAFNARDRHYLSGTWRKYWKYIWFSKAMQINQWWHFLTLLIVFILCVRSSPSFHAPPVMRAGITLVEKQAATTEMTFC